MSNQTASIEGRICRWSLDHPIDWRLVATEARLDEDGQRATLGLVWLIGCHFFSNEIMDGQGGYSFTEHVVKLYPSILERTNCCWSRVGSDDRAVGQCMLITFGGHSIEVSVSTKAYSNKDTQQFGTQLGPIDWKSASFSSKRMDRQESRSYVDRVINSCLGTIVAKACSFNGTWQFGTWLDSVSWERHQLLWWGVDQVMGPTRCKSCWLAW